jgi:surface antigen
MGFVSRSFAALCLGSALAVPAQAQLLGYYPFDSDALSLNNEDYMRLIDTANGLLRRSPLPVGTTAGWRNDQTGSAGTIRVTKTFRHGSMVCHQLAYDTTLGGTPPAKRTMLDWCDTGADGWKILPS